MPTADELRQLRGLNVHVYQPYDTDAMENFKFVSQPGYVSYNEARISGARLSVSRALFLRLTDDKKEVWADLITAFRRGFLCDAEDRAWVIFHVVHDQRCDCVYCHKHGAMITSLKSLDEVVKWDQGILGHDLKSRYRFVMEMAHPDDNEI